LYLEASGTGRLKGTATDVVDMNDVLGVIMGGGQGTRLWLLTKNRSKPEVPLAGKYRLIDIPISNCLHAGIEKISILTQFRSISLHGHIQRTYGRDMFRDAWVEILAADQSPGHTDRYQGTADAVRQKWSEIDRAGTRYVLILAGDHLYRMDYRAFVNYHVDTGADITLAVQPVAAQYADGLGILKRNADGEIVSFSEKPKAEALAGLESLPGADKPYVASMGIYIFSTELLGELLAAPGDDFGRHIIPQALRDHRLMGYVFDGYWADIGTIRRFYEVNLELVAPDRAVQLLDPRWPIYTCPRFLPPSEVRGSQLDRVLLADGSRIYDSDIYNSVVGLRSVIGPRATIRSSVLMGTDYYEADAAKAENVRLGRPDIGIGEGTIIDSAIIDKNAHIGRNVQIRRVPDRPDFDSEDWVAREGLVIVPKGGTIPDGSVI
jgi:glucose-1-phosphate adenylyltransferase